MKHRFIAKKYWNDMPTAMSGNKAREKGIIDLTFGDPDFTTPESIIAAAHIDVCQGHTHYTELYGDMALRQEVQKRLREDYQLDAAINELYITFGASHGLMLALQAILDPGDEVVMQNPSYTPYPDQVRLAGGIPVMAKTFEADQFELRADVLEQKITNRTKAILINNPCNPTGALFSRECLEGIAHIAKKYDLIVITDEVYAVMDFQKKFIPFASLDGMRERTITLCSASKEFAMTGWRVGFNFAPAELCTMMKRINENDTIMASSVAQRAYLHGLRQRQTLNPMICRLFQERVQYAYERICRMKNISTMTPRGSFYLFPNIKETGLTSEEAAEIILKEAKVAVFPGNAFGSGGEGYLRIACTRTLEDLKTAFDRMEKMDIFSRSSFEKK